MASSNISKKAMSVTIDKEILKKFNEFCEENSINKSKLIEKQIKKYLEDNDG